MGAEIYTVRDTPQPGVFAFTKFDSDLNPLTSYLVTNGECNCPRGQIGKTCRHRDMLPLFSRTRHIGDGWMFNRSTKQWIAPAGAIAEALAETQPAAASPTSAEDPPPEPLVLASAPAPTPSNGGGSALPSGFRKRRI